ncbi:MAG TPA: hypothetical protein VJ436_09020 [Anaerolineales bacterium]|nr:hypothetical protein [Anaerolineales bacterium]
MDIGRVTLVVCLTVLIVVGINAAFYVYLRKGNEAGQIELLQRAARRARQPWENEDQALQELSKRVAALQREGDPAGDPQDRDAGEIHENDHAR